MQEDNWKDLYFERKKLTEDYRKLVALLLEDNQFLRNKLNYPPVKLPK